jgi:hypothetical protein
MGRHKEKTPRSKPGRFQYGMPEIGYIMPRVLGSQMDMAGQ